MVQKKKNPLKRPTQKDVATKAGVSRPTVSLALKGSPTVSAETRAHIRKVADALGYIPDPMLSALSKYRNQDSNNTYQGTLAWISHSPKETPWNTITTYKQYYNGALKRAEQLGYNIEQFDLQQEKLSSDRLNGILNARGIKGLLVCPPGKASEQFDLPWDTYSHVTFGYTIQSPRLHRVSSSHYRATRVVFEKLRAAGYKRIGFAGDKEVNLKTQEHCLSAYLCDCQNANQEVVPVLLKNPVTSADFEKWYQKHRPDAVIITSPLWPEVKKTNIRIPEELAVASPMVPIGSRKLSGIIEKSQEIGAAAVDTLVQLIEHDERGLPNNPRYILLEGSWNKGSTIKA